MLTPTEHLFTLALGLHKPWECTKADFSAEDSHLELVIDFPPGSRFSCPICSNADRPVHDTTPKQWRHLDFFQHTCTIKARVPRVRCDVCGVRQVPVPWAREGSGFTLLFEALVLSMAPNMPVRAIARQLRTDDHRLWRILNHYVGTAREKEEHIDVTVIAVDETSSRRGHKYVTVVADLDRKRVIYATPGKGKDTLGRFTTDLHARNGDSDAIRHICMDMSPAYIAAATECFPNAAQTYDRFHVMKIANEALDEVRREDVRENPYLKGTRYLWLRHPEKLTAKQRLELAALQQLNRKTARAYQLVITLRQFWEMPIERGEEYLRDFCSWAMRSRLEPFVNLVRTIRSHWTGITNYHTSGMTTGFMEGINSLIQAAKRKARGYANVENLITMIYLIAGKLKYNLPI
jgi:transposase